MSPWSFCQDVASSFLSLHCLHSLPEHHKCPVLALPFGSHIQPTPLHSSG